MDGVTDAKIQAAIREEFNDSLLLTGMTVPFISTLFLFLVCLVAHRLRTVIDYDRLIVLDKGQVRTAPPLLLRMC